MRPRNCAELGFAATSSGQSFSSRSGEDFSPPQLVHGALAGCLVRSPAQETRPMTKSAAGEVVVLDLDDELWLERLPLCGSFGAPAAWTSWCLASEAGFLDQLFELGCELLLVLGGQAGAEPHVMKEAFIVVKAKQQR